ncbi:MAG: hypothetical protein KAI70_07125 [Candidatus Omnitrophica bacterium]|nr:hypothetical protein [Candidatus Omnitrophota bacterium]
MMVFVFWEGFFDYLGDFGIPGMPRILNVYKIAIVVYAVSLTWNKIFRFAKNKTDWAVDVTFLLFSASFWTTYYFYGGAILTILSQYLYKYGFVWIAYHYFKDITYNMPKREYVKNVLLTILFVQIAISVFKIILIGFQSEGLVGSMSFGGGGPAVVIPIVALIFYWLIRNGRFTKVDWIVTALIMTIAIASGKRQPIVIYPAVLLTLFVFVYQSVRPSVLLKYLLIAFVIFYIGVRMTSTFTPEKVVGGSFEISYVRDYVMNYYFGTKRISAIFEDDYQSCGRGAGIVFYFKPQRLTLNSDKELLFGKGRYEVAINKYGRFTKPGLSDYGVQHEGLMGEAGSLLYSFGYVGTIFMLLMAVTIIFSIKNKRLAWLVFLYFLWDFMFYYNQVIFFNSSALIVLIIIFYANSHGKEKMTYLKRRLQTVNRNKKPQEA